MIVMVAAYAVREGLQAAAAAPAVRAAREVLDADLGRQVGARDPGVRDRRSS